MRRSDWNRFFEFQRVKVRVAELEAILGQRKEANASKPPTFSGDYVDYGWDHRNRLTSVTFKDSLGITQKTIDYEYDVFNRRISKEVYDNLGALVLAQKFVYDGDDIVLVFDETGAMANRYLHGPDYVLMLFEQACVVIPT